MNEHIVIIILFFVGIILFLLARIFWLWYWKIDVRVRLLESIDKKMGAIINQGTDLDPEEIPKTIDTHDPLYIPSDNDEEQEPDNEHEIWVPIALILFFAVLFFLLLLWRG